MAKTMCIRNCQHSSIEENISEWEAHAWWFKWVKKQPWYNIYKYLPVYENIMKMSCLFTLKYMSQGYSVANFFNVIFSFFFKDFFSIEKITWIWFDQKIRVRQNGSMISMIKYKVSINISITLINIK